MTEALPAATVAREHYAWCRREGHSLRDIADSIGFELGPHHGEDDVLAALERRWLQVRQPDRAVHRLNVRLAHRRAA